MPGTPPDSMPPTPSPGFGGALGRRISRRANSRYVDVMSQNGLVTHSGGSLSSKSFLPATSTNELFGDSSNFTEPKILKPMMVPSTNYSNTDWGSRYGSSSNFQSKPSEGQTQESDMITTSHTPQTKESVQKSEKDNIDSKETVMSPIEKENPPPAPPIDF